MASPSALPLPGPIFEARKSKILEQLALPDAEYSDASPKGTVDAGIRPLLAKINAQPGFVTTSSCAGRVSVFVEGRKTAAAGQPQQQREAVDGGDEEITEMDGQQDETSERVQPASTQTVAGLGGKGGGGTWLYVSHDPHPKMVERQNEGAAVAVVNWAKELGISVDVDDTLLLDATGGAGESGSERRLIHFKFEPMILHVLTASLGHAQLLLRCALHAGFRESGAVSLAAGGPSNSDQPVMPMVAVRSMGLGFESLLGYADAEGQRQHLIVPPGYLDTLMRIGHERFAENTKRIQRFEDAFRDATQEPVPRRNPAGGAWEDATARRERMRAEGLRRKAAMMRVTDKAERTEFDIEFTEESIA